MIILGVDPGTAAIGLGLIKYENKQPQFLSCDCLKTSSRRPDAERLNDLYSALASFIKKRKPDVIAVETLFFFKNQKTAFKVSQARGVILLAGIRQKIKICEYTPLQVKQALTGYGRAEKKQVEQMVKRILNLNQTPMSDDAADALAIAICCAHSLR
jgi:crossover junction endodeoxyribonuclease RuvC